MRVADVTVYDRARESIAAARSRQQAAADQVSSGTRVVHPWDDPSAAALILQQSREGARFAALEKGVTRASDELNSADAALGSVTDALSRVYELAVQGSTDTYSAADRGVMASEVDALRKSAIASLNVQVSGRFVFGGFKDGAAPFDSAGTYLGDTNVRSIEVAPGVYQDTSVRADVALKGVGGGVDVLTTLQTLTTALNANDSATVRGLLDSISKSIEQVSMARSQGGNAMSVLDAHALVLRASRDASTAQVAHEADADIFDASTRLTQAQQALEASLTAAAKSFGRSLLDKL
jgi:flagellar hook-associated protein 3 FlgL